MTKTTTRFIQTNLPCPKCQSSDAYTISERYDGSTFGYCFSCKTYLPLTQGEEFNLKDFTYEYLPWRGITRETMEAFKVVTKVNPEGEPIEIYFPYNNEGTGKVRTLNQKSFYSVGDMRNGPRLFGQDRFSAGQAKAITITEGELDTLSVYQMLGSAYPVVSVRSSVTAKADCSTEREYLNSFDKIYLCFDNDEPGNRAKAEVARLFDFNKVYDVKLSDYKDANDYLQNNKQKEFKNIWWNSKRFLPEGIISTFQEFDSIIDEDKAEASATFPFPTLQDLSYGIKTGKVYLFTALEGIGKTEIIRAIEYHLLKTTEHNIGIIHLEEDKARNLKGLAGYELGAPCHLPDSHISNAEIKAAIRTLSGHDERIHIYNHFGSDDPDVILDTIRFLATSCDCKYIFLDHISMVVSGLAEDDERKALDYISTRLAMMTTELDFALFLVSHVNDEGKTRGSRNISKIADLWVHLNRDQNADSEEQRNTTYLQVQKNRFGARTGPGGKLLFDLATFKISELEESKHIGLPPLEVLG